MSDKVEGKSAIKKRIRSINRLLAKEDLPESVRITKEAALKSLHGLLNDRQKSEQQKKIIKKYKMVKFFDKRKVSRRLKSTLLAISQSADDTEKLELLNEAKRLKDELNYVVHYPSTEKYISLYPTTETSSAKAQKRREELLAQISAQVQKGELPNVADVCSWSRVSEETGSQLTVTTQQERVEVPLHFVSPLKKGGKQKRKMSTSVSKNADSGIAVKSGAAVDEEPESISDIYEHTKQKLKQDSFFL
eukprot:Em0022g724a